MRLRFIHSVSLLALVSAIRAPPTLFASASSSFLPRASSLSSPRKNDGHSNTRKSYTNNDDETSGKRGSMIDSIVSNQFRGGSDGSSSSNNNNLNDGEMDATTFNNNYAQPPSINPNIQTMQNNPNMQSADPMGMGVGLNSNDPTMMYGQRETVEDRLVAWRKAQQERQQTQSIEEAASAIDEQGRFKLFTTVSRVSVSFFFFILMWRTVHHYELADATFGAAAIVSGGKTKGGGGLGPAILRATIVTPLVVLFLGEMMGAILGLTGGGIGGSSSSSHVTKKRLKGILNLHKFVELIMMVYNVVRLAIAPSRYTPREVYIGRTISNFFFLMQAQLYTKLSWDDVSKTNVGDYATESYYDDYTPVMTGYDDDYASWQSSSAGNEYGYGGPMQHQQQPQQYQQQQQQQQQQQNYDGQGWS